MNRFVRRAMLGVVALLVVASACGGDGSPTTSTADVPRAGQLMVVTTVAPITSIVANIAGDKAIVTGVVPEGTNSHTFEPKPSVAEALSTADVIFINGLQLEEPTKKLAEANNPKATAIVELGNMTITPDQYIYDFSFPKDEGKPNPHLWTNPPMAKRYAEVAADTLAELDAANAGYYRANYTAFAAKIDALDGAMRADFATVAPEHRKLLTYHDAYAYFAKDYGWTVIGAIQVSDFEDPTAKEVADLIEQVKAAGVPAIFGSEVFPSPVLEQIGKEANVTYVDELRDDDLPGAPGETGHSWLGLMRFDYQTMTEALGGTATELRALDVSDVVTDAASYPQ